ncbi:MAG: bifunctional N-acetylglucosamine-1-phosphate uridyltransferase/glucosamine-1-phosphate acetyltransferase [Sulfurovum sp. FS08-3]|nr:MAG: bifunctional N-acetylglucosamine-1-phosphate uridyltransferase/glucosamine-1-phosphate acetyltransferase [Sulfurovum sp. FS08-3]
MSISVVILAAGQGTRMKSDTPKVLHKISGQAMLFYAIDAALEVSDDVTVVVYHQKERIIQEIQKNYKQTINFHIQDVANFPGTGGAMRDLSIKHKKVVILNGDMPLVTKDSIEALASGDGDINMSVIKLNNPSGYGRVAIKKGYVQEIIEEKDCNEAQKTIQSVNAGVYALKRKILESFIPKLTNDNAQKEYYLTDIIKMAVSKGKTINPVYVKEEEFKGVNSKLDLANAEIIMQNRIKEALMHKGVIMRLPHTIYIDSRATFEGEVILENGVSIEGKSHIGSSHIKTNSVVEESILINSTIGPMARIRPQSYLIDTHIGNFVEVKKSTLKGVKAGHLSYLGDSTIDEGTNIGAGVITCNYDGKNKYETVIGKNVFVGSDTQLIAPLIIEDDVLIGAGSTITQNISKGELAISRAPLKRVQNFFYKFFHQKQTS